MFRNLKHGDQDLLVLGPFVSGTNSREWFSRGAEERVVQLLGELMGSVDRAYDWTNRQLEEIERNNERLSAALKARPSDPAETLV